MIHVVGLSLYVPLFEYMISSSVNGAVSVLIFRVTILILGHMELVMPCVTRSTVKNLI